MATDEATPTTIAGSPNRRGRMELLYTPPLLEKTIHRNSIFAITNFPIFYVLIFIILLKGLK